MRGLFIRIFVWFWAGAILLVSVLLLTIYLTEPDNPPPHFRSVTRVYLRLMAAKAADEYERAGCEGLNGVFDRFEAFGEKETSLRMLIDSTGKGLCTDFTPDQVAALRKQAAPFSTFRPGRSSERPKEHPPSLTGTPVVASSGQSYLLIYELPPFRPPRFAVSRGVWFLRGLALLFTGGVVCYALAAYFAAPVRRLRGVARRFASGDLKARVGDDPLMKGKDELAELGRDFDEMAFRIEDLITRQGHLLESQRRLIGDVSHELRSPLTRLALASGLLQRKVSADALPLLSRIDRESERLNILVGQLLTLARLDANAVEDGNEPVAIHSLLQELVNDAAFEASARQVSILLTAEAECIMQGSRQLLWSAFENVLRNAIRYTADSSIVTVELACSDTSVELTISDEGPGVPEEDLAHLFKPFYRVDPARNRQSGGTGLGLAIVERTVRVHGGTVSASNRANGGLSVNLTFPATNAGEVERPVPVETLS